MLMFMTYLLPFYNTSVKCVLANILTNVSSIGSHYSGFLGLVIDTNVLIHFIAV